ncbi:MAG: hypothetical protein PWR07_1841 [Bacillota bacterium]|nr:hypothetical protein [Bacillota bacterium]
MERFNPRLRAGGDAGRNTRPESTGNRFNPRLRAGGDNLSRDGRLQLEGFNPRLRAGGDRVQVCSTISANWVSTHASAREATSPRPMDASMTLFQPTPPRGRRPGGRRQDPGRATVSTHASAREATLCGPARLLPRRCFNPRLRAGGDFSGCSYGPSLDVSTHASAREATAFLNLLPLTRCVSTHASAREATVDHDILMDILRRFNPRLRAGGDGLAVSATDPASSFNPRLRAGGDSAG